MREYLNRAVFEVFEKTVGESVFADRYHIKNGYVSKIRFKDTTEHEVIGVFKREVLAEVAKCLLFEEGPDEQIIIDLSKELLNLFAGNSKTLASQDDRHFLISTPEYLGIGAAKTTKDRFGFCFKGKRFTIYIS